MIQSKKFQRRFEDFTCENCGLKTQGNGYTDHCPACLWGKHVDVNPGDRKARCRGAMKPVRAVKKGDGFVIKYICDACGHEYRVKAATNDNFEVLLQLID